MGYGYTEQQEEQWYQFCEKCDKLIEELNSMKMGYAFRNIFPNRRYWPVWEYYIICNGRDYHYRYMFNKDDYERLGQFHDDEGCLVKFFVASMNKGELVYEEDTNII